VSLPEELLQCAPQVLAPGAAEVQLPRELLEREPMAVRVPQRGGHRIDVDFHD
jgi:hypothetical protein